jgi:hypothetical protein
VTTVTKARFIYLLVVASLFAYWLALFTRVHGSSDGGPLMS